MLTIRIQEDEKSRIEEAATRRGKTLSAFVLEAAMKATSRVEDEDPAKVSRGPQGVPAFFRTLCETAQAGGGEGYGLAGRMLARHAPDLIPEGVSKAEWRRQVDGLIVLSGRRMDWKVAEWFDQHFPECMTHVPSRRRLVFVQGAMYELCPKED